MNGTLIKRSDNFIFRKVVKEMVLVPIKQDVAELEHIFTLNEVGAFVWDTLSKPSTIEELQQAVLEEFDVEPEVAQQDLHEFLNALDALNALERSL